MKNGRTSRLTAFFTLLLITVLASGCSWMGRTAGRAQAKAERNIEAMEKSYKDGYESERGKTQAEQDETSGAKQNYDSRQPR